MDTIYSVFIPNGSRVGPVAGSVGGPVGSTPVNTFPPYTDL